MAALDAGCAGTTWPHWYAYALVKGRASFKNVLTPLSFFPSCLFSFFLLLHFLFKSFLPSTHYN